MTSRHGVTPEEANSALDDPDVVTFEPDPSSISGKSIRIIGRAALSGRIVTIIVLDHDGTRHGVNGWPSNDLDRRRYITGGDTT